MTSMTEKPETLDGLSVADFLSRMPEGMGRLNEKMGIEILEISAERIVGTMPVAGNTQPYGLLHGGASVVLAETLGSVGSAMHAYPDRLSVGVDINATHHRAATRGTVTGVATAIHLGRTMASYEVVDHRRARQAPVHVADHLRTGPGGAGAAAVARASMPRPTSGRRVRGAGGAGSPGPGPAAGCLGSCLAAGHSASRVRHGSAPRAGSPAARARAERGIGCRRATC